MRTSPGRRRELGERTLVEARSRFGADRYHERLLAVYDKALASAYGPGYGWLPYPGTNQIV